MGDNLQQIIFVLTQVRQVARQLVVAEVFAADHRALRSYQIGRDRQVQPLTVARCKLIRPLRQAVQAKPPRATHPASIKAGIHFRQTVTPQALC